MPRPKMTSATIQSRPEVEFDQLLGWLATAQQCLPAMDHAELRADQMVALARLIDRMQRLATGLRPGVASRVGRAGSDTGSSRVVQRLAA